jgi:serine protease inhibitor
MRHLKISPRKVWLGVLICAAGLPALADSVQDQAGLAAANTAFAFDLFRQIVREQSDANVFISPFSVSTVLQMIENGAAGTTKQEMERVLHTDNLPTNVLNAACLSLNQSLNSQTNVILELANAIWYKQGIALKPGFVSANKEFFHARLGAVDFGSPKSAQSINDWADRSTHGKIRQVVQWPFDPATRLVLANAIYFKGKWEVPFDKKGTKPHAFHLAGGGEKQVPTMWQHGRFAYRRGDDFQAVQLPYAGGRLRMDVFLPDANSTPAKLLARFDSASDRNQMLAQFLEREGTLALPRFKLEYGVKLNNSLQALGLKRAFNGADFSAMSGEPLVLSEVRQKSYVAVDEEGTEAAAVTTGVMTALAIERPVKPFEMIVDRPFFFVIEDGQTQSILFMGVVYNPASQDSK